ncbi:IncF plasmid conjugative transfer surface exclusion protein TraT [Desulfurella amilsii]|uniref:IncF plasmid conjugative transfer surface exclusion protein TraT n=1 Tax=Desulfurella amilsii TaxID=1562698 RepID=A0A1X4XZM9_9BACT|nr:complement resistance protein TraT [Desulfurella amilsii]OSS42953.1 IncF plasmid conjugative transfer surface exclusion protein TraT [Desulfurella amilsii]
MKRFYKHFFSVFFALGLVFYLSSCATVMSGIENTKLQTQAKMSNTIFLNPVSPAQKTIYVQVRNTSQVPMPDLKAMVIQKLQTNGYRIVEDPQQAHYWLQANVLYMGKQTQFATFDGALAGGFGGALAGVAIGQGYGKGAAALGGAAVGSLLGAAVGSAIHVDTYLGVVDVQVSERVNGTIKQTVTSNYSQGESGPVAGATITHKSSGSYNSNANYTQGTYGTNSTTQIQENKEGTQISSQYEKESNYQASRTRIAVEAKQTNMDLKKVTPDIENLISNEIAGIF